MLLKRILASALLCLVATAAMGQSFSGYPPVGYVYVGQGTGAPPSWAALGSIFGTQSANTVYAGPTTGSAADPTFRALVGADLPAPSASTLGGVESLTCPSHEWLNTISTAGIPACGQPGFTDLSGALATDQLPALASGDIWLGNGSGAAAAVTVSGDCTLSNAGALTCTKTNGTAFAASATTDTTDASNISSGTLAGARMSAVNLADSGNGGVTGDLPYAQISSVPQATDSVQGVMEGDGTTITCTAGVCTASGASATSGFYTLQYVSSAWTCTAPDGSSVSTSGTTTDGLQECINAMQTNKDGNFRAICPTHADDVPITATTTVTFGPNDSALYDLRGCYFTSSAATAIDVDSLEFSSTLDWSSGWIQCTGATTACVELDPVHATPEGIYGIGWSTIKFPSIVESCSSNGADSYEFYVDPGNTPAGNDDNAAIYGSLISIAALDGYDGTHTCPVYGMYVINPTNVYAAFGQNDIRIGYIQAFESYGIINGSGAITQSTQALATNNWYVGSVGSGPGTVSIGIGTYGFDDRWYANVSVNGGTLGTGFEFAASTANGNWFIIPQLDATTTPFSDSGTSVDNIGVYNGTVHNF